MQEASEKGGASRLFGGDYLAVTVMVIDKIIDTVPEAHWDTFRKSLLDRLYSVQKRDSDVLLPYMHSFLRVTHFSPIVTPYSVFPIRADHRLDLLTGRTWVWSLMNVSGLARWLNRRGWQAEALSLPSELPPVDEFPHVSLLRASQGPLTIELGMDTLIVAAMEFWMPESIEAMLSAIRLGARPNVWGSQVNLLNTGKYAWD